MKLTGRHLQALKAPLGLLAAVAIAGAAAVAWTRSQIDDNQRALAAQERLLQEARNRFQRSGDERNLIVRYLRPYEELRGRGLVGPEERINWLDALRTTNQELGLFGAEYQVSTQQLYPYAQELNATRLGMAQSVMRLNLALVHEGQLMRFFHRLESRNAGAFEINQCVLERTSGAGIAPKVQPNLRAECELAWITINPETVQHKP